MKHLLTGLIALIAIVIVAGSMLLPASAEPGTQGNCLAAALPIACVGDCLADIAQTCASGVDIFTGLPIDTNLCAQTIATNVMILVNLPPAGPACDAATNMVIAFCVARGHTC